MSARSKPVRTTAIFSKRPRPGEVKTRLTPPLTSEEAARVAEAMLVDTVRRAADGRVELHVTPESSVPWFEERFPEVEVVAQRGAHLGQRLAHFFEGATHGTRVVVGSDAPHVERARIVAAHRALADGADLVLGPDEGGGYYLVGSTGSNPELFTEIEMSTTRMFADTVALAERRRLSVYVLPSEFDVDRFEDLERLASLLSGRSSVSLSETRRVLRDLAILR